MQPFIIRDNEGIPLWLNNNTYTIKLDKENTGETSLLSRDLWVQAGSDLASS
jgi:hypothetical protein